MLISKGLCIQTGIQCVLFPLELNDKYRSHWQWSKITSCVITCLHMSHDLREECKFLSVIFQETVLFLLQLENTIDKLIASVVTDLWHTYINTGWDASLAKKNRHTWKNNVHHLWRPFLSHCVAAWVQKRAYLVSAFCNSLSSSSFGFLEQDNHQDLSANIQYQVILYKLISVLNLSHIPMLCQLLLT